MSSNERTDRSTALAIAERILLRISDAGIRTPRVAGSLRRGLATVGDVDLLVADDHLGDGAIPTLCSLPEVEQVLSRGPKKASVLVARPGGGVIQVDLRVVPEESVGAALQYFTGSKQHNIAMRRAARNRGWLLNEYGLFDGDGNRLAGETEEGIYAAFGQTVPLPAHRDVPDPSDRRTRARREPGTVGRIRRNADDAVNVMYSFSLFS